MNDFLLALGNFFLAMAGFVTFYIETFTSSVTTLANSIAKTENLQPTEATRKAEEIKHRRAYLMFVPWIIGMLLAAAGLICPR